MGEVDKLRVALETFCSTRTDDLTTDNIPDDLESILKQIAQSGVLPWELQWKQISYVVRRKILFCIHQMNTMKKYTGAQEEYTETMDMILSQVDMFEEAPFTIQRVCELLIEPGKHYASTDKYMRALLKNLLVVSGWRKQPESDLPPPTTELEKDESTPDTKMEPDSTSEGVSFGTGAASPPRRREDSPEDPDCDSTNQQPDSTTADSSKEADSSSEVKPEKPEENPESDQTSESPTDEDDGFKERPKTQPDEDDDMDVFESMKSKTTKSSPPKRKVALSNTKIQIQVGVGKGVPKTEENQEAEDPVTSSTSDDPKPDSDEEMPVDPPAAESPDKTEPVKEELEPEKETEIKPEVDEKLEEKSEEATEETPGISEAPETSDTPQSTEHERKRKRSSEDPENATSPTSPSDPATTSEEPLSTPQKLQKTE